MRRSGRADGLAASGRFVPSDLTQALSARCSGSGASLVFENEFFDYGMPDDDASEPMFGVDHVATVGSTTLSVEVDDPDGKDVGDGDGDGGGYRVVTFHIDVDVSDDAPSGDDRPK